MSIPPRVWQIVEDVASRHDLEATELVGESRRRRVVGARREMFAQVRAMRWGVGRPSYPQIAAWFDRHHTSVIHAVRRHEGGAE